MRMVGLRGLALGFTVLLGLVAQVGAASAVELQASADSTAYGIKVLLPNQGPIVAGYVDANASTVASPVSFAYPDDGSILRAESVAGRSWALGGKAQARADVRSVSLFRGEI